jgi:hypothetical protein
MTLAHTPQRHRRRKENTMTTTDTRRWAKTLRAVGKDMQTESDTNTALWELGYTLEMFGDWLAGGGSDDVTLSEVAYVARNLGATLNAIADPDYVDSCYRPTQP